MGATVTGELGRLARLAVRLGRARAFNAHVVQTVLPVFEGNFVVLSSSNRNRFGARGGFWNRMLSGTKAVATAEAAIVRMPAEVRLRHKGGTVTPKVAKYLAIPLRAESYGKSPRQFRDLHPVPLRSGKLLLVRAPRTAISIRSDRKTGRKRVAQGRVLGGEALFLLTTSATIRPNPRVLPEPQKVGAAALEAARNFFREVNTK